MKCIIYQQYKCSFNVVLFIYYVKFYVIVPKLFHTPSQIAPQKCFAIVYLFEENRLNCLFSKVFF